MGQFMIRRSLYAIVTLFILSLTIFSVVRLTGDPVTLLAEPGNNPICYIGEVGPVAAVSRDIPNLGPRVSIVDHQGTLIGRFGDTPAGAELGKFLAPHGLAVDSRGDVYVGEVSWTAWPQINPGKPHPADLRSLQKFEKVE